MIFQFDFKNTFVREGFISADDTYLGILSINFDI